MIASGSIGLAFASEQKSYVRKYSAIDWQLFSLADNDYAVNLDDNTNVNPQSFSDLTSKLQLSSKWQSYDLERKIFVAEGSAIAVLNGYALQADRIELDRNNDSLFAKGNVRFRKGDQFFQASSLEYNLITREGYLENVYGVINFTNLQEQLAQVNRAIHLRDRDNLFSDNRDDGDSEQTLSKNGARDLYIEDLNQKVKSLEINDSFMLQGKFGVPFRASRLDNYRESSGDRLSKIQKLWKDKFISGSIQKWRVQAMKLQISPNGWRADKISFTNDPLTPSQVRIDATDVVATEEDGDLLIKTDKNILILEESLRLPLLRNRRIRKKDNVHNRWVVGIDVKDRDGLFLGRQLKPISLGENFTLSMQPQFLIQRSFISETDKYANSSKAKKTITSFDLFGLKSSLNGIGLGWNVDINTDISSLNTDHLSDATRLWMTARKSLNIPILDKIDANIFGAYRYRAWNGSLGETDIYSAYGFFLEKKGNWNYKKLQNNYLVRTGLGNYKADLSTKEGSNFLWRTNFYASLKSSYPVWKGKISNKALSSVYRYSPLPIVPGLAINTSIKTSYFAYNNGNSQSNLSFSAGPTLTLGHFTKPFLDYSRLSVFVGATIKQGNSPFDFDNVIDLATIGVDLSQQLFGPLVINSSLEYNIDRSSKYYGKPINSQFELRWQRRSYDMAIFYNPYQAMGGFKIRLNDFRFQGTGLPFMPGNDSESM